MTDRQNSWFRLLYVSKNLITGEPSTLVDEINKILRTAQTANSAMGVTGLLIFNKGYFAQVLEGNCQAVEEIFERIQNDNRHADIVVLEFKPTSELLFADWSMGFVGSDVATAAAFEDFQIDGDETVIGSAAEALLDTMRKLALRNEISLEAV